MFQHTGTFKQSSLIGFTLEDLHVRAFNDSRQIGLQLTHVSGSIDDIDTAVIIKEQRSIVEMAHP